MSEIHILLLCGLFFMPIAVILAMGVFWAYVWIKESFVNTAKEYEKHFNCGPTPEQLNKIINNKAKKAKKK